MNEQTEAANTKRRITSISLPKAGLIGCWILGGASIAVGGLATFVSDNQAGTTALIAFGGVLLFLGISGRLPLAVEVGNTRFDATFYSDSVFQAGRESALDIPAGNEEEEEASDDENDALEEVDLRDWEKTLFPGPSACKLSATTYRQLDYWVRTGLVNPSGGQQGFTLREVISLAATKRLLDVGLSLQNIRVAIAKFAGLSLSELEETVVVFEPDGEALFTTLSNSLVGFDSAIPSAYFPLKPVIGDVRRRLAEGQKDLAHARN